MTRDEWIDAYARELGVNPPSEAEIKQLLELARIAAHASERTAAPLSCWMLARAGRTPDEALAAAKRVAA